METPAGASSLEKRGVHAELETLRARARELEAKLKAEGAPDLAASRAAAHSAVREAWPERDVTPQPEAGAHTEAIRLNLSPEKHDEKMGELIGILQVQGVSAAITAAEATGSPHLVDDFHRILVEFVHEGLKVKGSPAPRSALSQALGMSLLEITLPLQSREGEKVQQDATKETRDFIARMEQLYRGTLSLGSGFFFSFEIANKAGSRSTSAYLAVPGTHRELFEKQIVGLFPSARIEEVRDDYNIFSEAAEVAGAYAVLSKTPAFGLRNFEEMPNDPLDTLLSAFSRLDQEGEGAAVQFVVCPKDLGMPEKFRKALKRVQEGMPLEKATRIRSGVGEFLFEATEMMRKQEEKKDLPLPKNNPENPTVKAIERKLGSPLMLANVRLIASAHEERRAHEVLGMLQAPFEQLSDSTVGSRLSFKGVPQRGMKRFINSFSYRLFDEGTALPLTCSEIASFAHLPHPHATGAAPEVKQERSAVASAPLNMPTEGVLLGVNKFRGTETQVYITPEDRLRHLYVLGQTGTGKSKLLDNIIVQDIKAGNGACFIDPHGSDVLEVLSAIPENRWNDVIYFDPGSIERPMALNMLEYDPAHPEQKTLVVDELLGIFKKLFGAIPESMGPAFEQYFRNAALLVMDDPGSGNTLLDIARVFSDDTFRMMKIARCKNVVVARFWKDIASRATGDQGLQNYAPYITSKFDAFTTNEIMRPIIAQQHSSLNFRKIMDEKKILLVNLAKGRIGDINANLLGLIIVGKFLLAALSRADAAGQDLPPFYLFIDEFQNFTTPSVSTILSEARKYKLSLTMAHQFINQLPEDIRNAVFGNVGSLVSFRVGTSDAEFLEKQFAPTFSATDLMNVDNRHAFAKLLIGGVPAQPFSFETLRFEVGSPRVMKELAQASSEKYGRPRAEVEAEIARTARW